MPEIALSHGKVALVDDEDYEALSRFRWRAHAESGKWWYAVRNAPHVTRSRGTIKMHRQILEAPKGVMVDHINGDTLDNRRFNLRLCTPSQNSQNRHVTFSASGLRGVTLTTSGRWQAQTSYLKQVIYLGVFDTPEEAGRAYDAAVLELHGPNAALNFPKEAGA